MLGVPLLEHKNSSLVCGFVVSWFLDFLVSKFYGFLVFGFLVSKFQGFTKFPFYAFRKILLSYPSSSRFYQTGLRDFRSQSFSTSIQLDSLNFEIWKTDNFKNVPDMFLIISRYPGASKDNNIWFWGSGTRHKIPKS